MAQTGKNMVFSGLAKSWQSGFPFGRERGQSLFPMRSRPRFVPSVPSGKEMVFTQGALEAYGEELLRLRLQVRNVMSRRWKGGGLPENVIDSHRLIFLAKGGVNYRVENTTRRLLAPGILYVPGWVRRGWESIGPEGNEMSWVEFSSDILDPDFKSPLFLKGRIPVLEGQLLQDLLKIWGKKKDSALGQGILEHQTKTLLARFFDRVRSGSFSEKTAASALPSEGEVIRLMDYLKTHFAEPGVLQKALAGVGISPDYLRRLFYRRTGQSMQAYVTQLRMRKARYLLNGTTLRIKEVADQTGCRDPLRFSKMYREFWGHPPSAERTAGR